MGSDRAAVEVMLLLSRHPPNSTGCFAELSRSSKGTGTVNRGTSSNLDKQIKQIDSRVLPVTPTVETAARFLTIFVSPFYFKFE